MQSTELVVTVVVRRAYILMYYNLYEELLLGKIKAMYVIDFEWNSY